MKKKKNTFFFLSFCLFFLSFILSFFISFFLNTKKLTEQCAHIMKPFESSFFINNENTLTKRLHLRFLKRWHKRFYDTVKKIESCIFIKPFNNSRPNISGAIIFSNEELFVFSVVSFAPLTWQHYQTNFPYLKNYCPAYQPVSNL
jgi:hypothetical protein